MKFTQPITVTWSDILVSFKEGEEVLYESSHASGIRHAISRRLKFTHPDLMFTTSIDGKKIIVRRLTQEEITQQQQSAERAG